MTKRRLPPLNPLKSFEAAARNGSFTKAAEELSVSPVAISRQVAVLEEYFGVKFFERRAQIVTPTQSTRDFLPAITTALDLIHDASISLRQPKFDAHALTVSTYPSFALGWLIPRLYRFREAHPNIEINMSTAVSPSEIDYKSIDLVIMRGYPRSGGLIVQPILPDIIQPVCSPLLLERPHPPTSVENLSHHTFLHSRHRRMDWNYWMKGAGLKMTKPHNELTFKGSRLAYQAAVNGLGIAVAQPYLVSDEIASGKLIFPLYPPIQNEFSYCITRLKERHDDPQVDLFCDWIGVEAQDTIKELDLPTSLPMF